MIAARRVIVVVLGGWFLFATAGATNERSTTYDEVLHLAGGWTYSRLGDYRLHPTNGNLTQRWLTAPLKIARPSLPPTDGDDFRRAERLGEPYGQRFLFDEGNDHRLLAALSRAMNAILGLGLGLLILRVGGIAAFALYCLCPNVLAHAGLATSDLGAAFGFFLCVWTADRLLHCWTWPRLIWSCVATAILFGVKMSAPLILPIVGLMFVGKLLGARGWRFRMGKRFGRWRGGTAVGAFAITALVHALTVWLALWSLYGWRYSAFVERLPGRDEFTESWTTVSMSLGFSGEFIRAARDWKLLPEAYLYGLAHTIAHSKVRPSFLSGQYSGTGWRWYFPVVFAIKTPLPTLLLLTLGGWLGYRAWIQAPAKRRCVRIARALPWWILIGVYGFAAVQSNLNLGYRHLLPILPPMFVLAGGFWRRPPMWIWPLFVWLAVESVRIHPYQLAYFNQTVGGPANGYKHLADSNLDWGQDLPSLARWRHGVAHEPAYLVYFGTAKPSAYGVDVPPPFDQFLDDAGLRADADLGGWYCVSATAYIAPAHGPAIWSEREEAAYRAILEAYPRLTDAERKTVRPQLLTAFTLRLRVALHRRPPDATVGYSILLFRLTDADVRRALFDAAPMK